MVNSICENADIYKAIKISNMKKLGLVLFDDFVIVYLKQKKISEAKTVLSQEVERLVLVLDPNHILTSIIEFSLV